MKISIITPSFNQAEFIERTILSVLSQKGNFEIEYMIMDGGSTDGSLDIIRKYDSLILNKVFPIACNEITFIWKSEKDHGQSDAINKGLKLATGDIVTYLNSDDTYNPDALQNIVTAFENPKTVWTYGKCKIINKEDREIRKWITFYKNIIGRKYSYSKLLSENFISQMTVFWRKELLEEIGFFDINEHLCMDYEYWLRIGEKYHPTYIDQYIANFRFYHTSKSGSRFKIQFSDELRLAKKYAKGKHIISLWLHKLNYYKIVFIYSFLSLIKK